jgi:hypothetical protein
MQKNWIINKELKRTHSRGDRGTECTGEGGRDKELTSAQMFSKQSLEK